MQEEPVQTPGELRHLHRRRELDDDFDTLVFATAWWPMLLSDEELLSRLAELRRHRAQAPMLVEESGHEPAILQLVGAEGRQ